MSKRGVPKNTNFGRFPTGDSVVIERLLPGSVPEVWDYLTEPLRLRRWLARGSVDLRAGGAIGLDFDQIECPGREDVHGTMFGTITACDPPRLLAFTWGESGSRELGDPDSLVTFELRPVSDHETMLRLTHSLIVRKDLSPIAAGWHVHLDVLASRLAGEEPGHFMEAWSLLEPQYRKRL